MDNKKIGKLIASLRKTKGLTQQELGDMVGVGFRAVSKWERGMTLPDISIINELSQILGITSDELLSGEVNKISNPTKKKSKRITISISILTTIIIIITSIFIYYQNKTYVYNMVSYNEDEFIIKGHLTYKNKDISIIINKIYFNDKTLLKKTIIKNYDYMMTSDATLLFGYGINPNGKNIEENVTIEEFEKNFRVNYEVQTDLKRRRLVKNNTVLKFNFITQSGETIKREIKIKLIPQ